MHGSFRRCLGGVFTLSERLDASTVVAAASDVVSCDLAGGSALLDLHSSRYFTLNEVGSRIWELVKEPRPVEAIRDGLADAYDVDSTQCHAELVVFLERMIDAGLITVSHAPRP